MELQVGLTSRVSGEHWSQRGEGIDPSGARFSRRKGHFRCTRWFGGRTSDTGLALHALGARKSQPKLL